MRFPLINNANYRNIIEQENVTSTVSTPFNLVLRMLRKDNMDFNKIRADLDGNLPTCSKQITFMLQLDIFVLVSLLKVFVLKCKYV